MVALIFEIVYMKNALINKFKIENNKLSVSSILNKIEK